MNGIKRIICLGFVALALVLPLLGGRPVAAWAPAGSGWGLIDAVNALRIAYGLAPYKVNDALMAAAQSHSDFQAANGVMTHTGKGGSNSRGRAAAFGYGGGAQVYVSENIAAGTSMSAQEVVDMWATMDAVHRNTLLSPSYTDVGAGVSSSGGTTYYTLDVGYVAGAAGSAPPSTGGQSGGQTGGQAVSSAPAVPLIMPVKVAEPQEDGSVVHTVEPGHTLIRIAEAYEIPLADLLGLNNLTFTSIIYPGEKILIQPPAPSATPTEEVEETTPTTAPRPTRPPTNTPVAKIGAVEATPIQTIEATPTVIATGDQSLALPADPVLLAIGGLIVLGTVLLVAGGALRRGGS